MLGHLLSPLVPAHRCFHCPLSFLPITSSHRTDVHLDTVARRSRAFCHTITPSSPLARRTCSTHASITACIPTHAAMMRCGRASRAFTSPIAKSRGSATCVLLLLSLSLSLSFVCSTRNIPPNTPQQTHLPARFPCSPSSFPHTQPLPNELCANFHKEWWKHRKALEIKHGWPVTPQCGRGVKYNFLLPMD